jgi:hypothetical protein
VGATVTGAVVAAAAVGAVVLGAAVGAIVPGAEVTVGAVEALSAMTLEVPNGVSARATTTARATETAGYATTARSRRLRVGPMLMCFTGNFLG